METDESKSIKNDRPESPAFKAARPRFFREHRQKTENVSAAELRRIDYKEVELLRKFLDPYGRILSKRRGGSLTSKQQRQMALAIKRARFLALLPFIAK